MGDAKWLLTGIYTLNKKVQYVKFLMLFFVFVKRKRKFALIIFIPLRRKKTK